MNKVLVIEDEYAIRSNIAEILEDAGFAVLEAEDGMIGFQMAIEHLPDLILCDVMMPQLDGYGVVKALRQNIATSTTPFIFLTAKAEKADFRQGMVLGADDYLTKPFTSTELVEAITSRLVKQAAIVEKHTLELKQLEEKYSRLLYYDGITGLPNQFLLRDHFKQFLTTHNAGNHPIAIFCLNLHQFNRLRNALDSALFNQLLNAFAHRLKTCVTPDDTITRLKENQFAILGGRPNQAEIIQTAQLILDSLVQPFSLQGQDIYLSASIGISLYTDSSSQVETLVRQAEIAAQSNRRQETNFYQFYTSELTLQFHEQLILENDLRTAWEAGRFQIYYQPQINAQTGQLVGAEALIRCTHPEQGLLSPAKFMPIAEETGLIVPIGEWVIKTVCQQAKAWQVQGYPPFRVAVNLSARQFNQPNLSEIVTQALQEAELAPNWLELEVTESCVMEDLEAAIATLKALQDEGIHIALDDFGTGYSSLSYLKQIPLTTLKIDKSFISNIQADLQNREIVKTIIQMAHSLNLSVVAEGVETEAELDCLCQYQCNELQGYLFSRPLPIEKYEEFVKSWCGFKVKQ